MMTDVKRSYSVVLVEDVPADAELTEHALRATGLDLEIRYACRLDQALLMVRERAPDLVLLDLGLPDAAEFESLCKLQEAVGSAPIIVLSGQADTEVAARAVGFGAQDYLVKGDFTPGELSRSISYGVQRNRAQQELLRVARHDAVTGLCNRVGFMALLEIGIGKAERNGGSFTLLYLDLDHFKLINDGLGHAAGDELLRQIAARLQQCVRASDVVARIGGDEFTVLLENVEEPGSITRIASKILDAVKPPFVINGFEVSITPSIGAAVYPHAAKTSSALLKSADTAMYRAKENGRNTVAIFTDEMDARVLEAFELEYALRQALPQDEFELLFQPIMGHNGDVRAIESLLRWNRGSATGVDQLYPGDFIPILERTGLICEVGEWVLREACGKCSEWRRTFDPGIRVAVNISPIQVQHGDLLRIVQSILDETGLAPSALELEITEEELLYKSYSNVKTLKQLRALGITLSIDDFGTGYSSLSYLMNFPFDTIKIDRGFMEKIPGSLESEVLAVGMISIARGLGRDIIAEGVETIEQYDFLRQHNCMAFQGYLFSHPLSCDAIQNWLGTQQQFDDARYSL